MRTRVAIAALLLLPSVGTAQARTPRIGGARPGQAVPLGPQPEVVRRAIAYQRSRYSVETYPMISRIVAPGFSGGRPIANWTFGTGTRLDYRRNSFMSWTLDLTSSYLGGPAMTETAEAGVRFHSSDWEQRLRPFADLRLGFQHAHDAYSSPGLGIGPAASGASAIRYSRGYGAVAGAGVEYSLTNTFALTGGVAAMRSDMTAYHFNGISAPRDDDNFRMTTYRFTLGVRYNPVHLLRQ